MYGDRCCSKFLLTWGMFCIGNTHGAYHIWHNSCFGVCWEPISTCWYDNIIKWHHHCTSIFIILTFLHVIYINQFNLDDVLKTVDPRFNRPGKGNLKDYLLGLREPPLAPLKGTSASLCKAFADSFDHALYGYKVSYKSGWYQML